MLVETRLERATNRTTILQQDFSLAFTPFQTYRLAAVSVAGGVVQFRRAIAGEVPGPKLVATQNKEQSAHLPIVKGVELSKS